MEVREGGRTSACIMVSNTGLRTISLRVSTQPFNYLFTHSVIQQYFKSYYVPALYRHWGECKKWSLKPRKRGEQADMRIQESHTCNSKPEWHWNPEKGVVFQKYRKLHMEMFKPTQNLYIQKSHKTQVRLQHRSNKIAIKKKLTKSIASKS